MEIFQPLKQYCKPCPAKHRGQVYEHCCTSTVIKGFTSSYSQSVTAFTIYPNPSLGNFKMSVGVVDKESAVTIQVVNGFGQLVYTNV
ncbi:MAG: hypothetical protein H7320_09930 [Ferruginibacter sp.]|nr:hypothetical protein [Ferruginibacter sp.]